MPDARKPFMLRLSPHMLQALERWAQDEFRSTNGQIEYLLHQALLKAGRMEQGGDQKTPRQLPAPPKA